MIRNSLYAAASVAAIMAAGVSAQAGTISGSGNFTGVNGTTASVSYKLADELTFSDVASTATAHAATRGSLTYGFAPSSSFPTGNSLLLTLDVSGAILTGAEIGITGTGSCTVTTVPTAVNGAAANATTAQYLVTLGGTCTSATGNAIAITLPVQATGQSIVAGAKLQQAFGNTTIDVDGGRAQATFVELASAYAAGFSTAGAATATAEVSSGYKNLLTAVNTVGSYSVTVDTNVRKDLSGNAAAATDVISHGVVIEATPGFAGIALASGASTSSNTLMTTASATIANTRSLSVTASGTAASSFFVIDNTATATTTAAHLLDGVIETTALSGAVTVRFATASGIRNFTATGSIYGVNRNGSSFTAPWVALGSTTQTSTIRLANNGTTATGPITVSVKSVNGAELPAVRSVTLTPSHIAAGTPLTASNGIPAGGAVSFNGSAIAAALGVTSGNGDIEISIEAPSGTITAKSRITQAGTNQIFESALQ